MYLHFHQYVYDLVIVKGEQKDTVYFLTVFPVTIFKNFQNLCI